jgi:N-acetyl-anhydromuramoyl-L-alanine amidase
MKVDEAGCLSDVQFISSPNCDNRPPGNEIRLLVIHNISMPPNVFEGDGVIDLFTNQLNPNASYYEAIRNLRVSAHFFVRRDGKIIQFVPCGKRAWHAGKSCWKGQECCNDFSIGVEMEGSDTTPFTDSQYTALVDLTMELNKVYPIADIIGHSDISPKRKTDPGPYFDWHHYQEALRLAKLRAGG